MNWSSHATAALRSRNFRLMWTGRVFSHTGGGIHGVALAVLVLQLSGDSAIALGAIAAVTFAPQLLGGVWAGMIIDRIDAYRGTIVQQCASAAVSTAMAALTMTGAAELWMVYTLLTLTGISTAFSNPLQQALLGRILPPGAKTSGIALNSITFQGGALVGALLGGALVGAVGPGLLLAAATCCYIPSLLTLAMMRPGEMLVGTPVVRASGQIRAGLAHIATTPQLWSVFASTAAVSLLGMGITTLAPVAAVTTLGQSEAAVGWVSAAIGAGGALSQIMVAGIALPTARHRQVRLGVLAVALAVAAMAPNLTVLLLASAAVSWAAFGHQTLAQSAIHHFTPADMIGRVIAAWFSLASAKAIAGMSVGALADAISPRGALGVSAALVAAAAFALGRVWEVRAIR